MTVNLAARRWQGGRAGVECQTIGGNMKRNQIIITLALLIIVIANYFLLIHDGGVRTVEFLFILAMGILTGVFLTQAAQRIRKTEK